MKGVRFLCLINLVFVSALSRGPHGNQKHHKELAKHHKGHHYSEKKPCTTTTHKHKPTMHHCVCPTTCASPTALPLTTSIEGPVPSSTATVGSSSPSQFLTAAWANYLTSIGFASLGTNSVSPGYIPWIGNGGVYTITLVNTAGKDLAVAFWGPAGSWVQAVKPQITITLANATSQTISFPAGVTGAFAPIDMQTTLVNGQLFQTWAEFDFRPQQELYDISRIVSAQGISMRIVGSRCTTDMNTCVFVCNNGENTCFVSNMLQNCANGSQPGATYGIVNGQPVGGCSGLQTNENLIAYIG